MDKSQARKLWERLYGDKTIAYDFAAQEIHKDDYRDRDSFYCWTEDFIRPLTSGGRNIESNYRIESIQSFDLRERKSNFRIGNALFEVRKGKKYGTYALFDVTDRNHPFNREPNSDNQNERYNRNRFNLIYGSKQNNFLLKNPSAIGASYFKENTKELSLSSPEIIERPDDEDPISPNPAEEAIDPSFTLKPEEEADAINDENNKEPIPEEKAETEQNETALEPSSVPEREETNPESMEEPKDASEDKEELSSDLKKEDEELSCEEEKTKEPVFTKEDIESYQDEIASLKDTLRLVQEDKDALIKEKEDLSLSTEESLKALSEELEEKKTQLSLREKEKENLTSSLYALKEEKEKAESSLLSDQRENEKAKEGLNLEKQELIRKKEEREASLSSALKENEDLKALLEKQKQEWQEKETSSSSLRDGYQKQEEELKTKISSLQEEISRLQNEEKTKEDAYQENLASLKALLEQKEQERKKQRESDSGEKDSLIRERNALKDEKASRQAKLDQIEQDKTKDDASYQELEKEYSQLEAQSSLMDDQKAQLETEIASLNESLNSSKAQLEEMKNVNENLAGELKESQDKEALRIQENEKLKSSLETSDKERDHRRKTSMEYNTKYTNLNTEFENAKDEWKTEKENYSQTIDTLTQAKDNLSKQLEEKKKQYLFYHAGGDNSYYDAYLFYRRDRSYPFDEEHAEMALNENPFWKRKEDRTVYPFRGEGKVVDTEDVSYLDEERKAKKRSRPLFEFYFGKEKKKAVDFSGRLMRKEDFRREESPCGWDYRIYDSLLDEDKKSSYFLANRKTRKDISLKEPFKTNCHTYHLEKDDDGYRFTSLDDVYDIYDLPRAMEITKLNQEKTTPVLYLFVKVTQINGDETKKEDLSTFFDLLDRTVRRACPLSFRERKSTIRTKESHAFITFDGRQEGAYNEVLAYATLLNSYRNAFKKENKLNAVIVLDQVRLPFSFRHLSFENRLTETNDRDRRAVYYHLLQRPLIDSTIKRTIHIGPEILPRLNLPKERLGESKFICSNFALIYNFKESYVLYNYGYEIKK